ncbi:MAG TPA: FAD-dependent oxidoreductase [Thermomicrobiales bacterium]|nr:FAD-dependent oxidoreductase [Thermomicrobiales bacterium]
MATSHPTPDDPPRTSEVAVIGGGVTGCAVAYLLARRGVGVTVFERDDISSGASGRNTGIVATGLTNAAVPALTAWTLRNRDLLRELDRAWDGCFAFRERGSLHVLLNEDEWREAAARLDARRAAGVPVGLLTAEECRARVPLLGPAIVGGVFNPLGGQLVPYALAFALQRHAARHGARFRTRTPVIGLTRRGDRVTGVTTPRGATSAAWVVNATNGWAAEVGALAGLAPPIRPTRGQVLVTEPIPARMAPNVTAGRLEYWRQAPDGQVVMGGGLRADPEVVTTTPAVALAAVTLYSRVIAGIMPGLRGVRAVRMWAGIMGFTPDEAPLAGAEPAAPGLVTAAGFTGNGMPLALAVAEAVACHIAGEAPPLPLAPLSPGRFA